MATATESSPRSSLLAPVAENSTGLHGQRHHMIGGLEQSRLFQVFRAARWPVFRRYAIACVGCERTGTALALTSFTELHQHWAEALRSASPAAEAWMMLVRCTVPSRTDRVRWLYGQLTSAEADVVLLRHKLGLCTRDTADAMGIDAVQVYALRRQALRTMAAPSGTLHMLPAF